MTPDDYRRLPGSFVLPWTRESLYLGPDHVLRVTLTLFTESYRRYYLRDVETIVLAEKGATTVYVLVALGIFLVAASASLGYYSRFVLSGLSFVVGLVLLIAGLRVPTCACYLRTASAAERLRSLGRIGAARRALAILSPAIQAAQSEGKRGAA